MSEPTLDHCKISLLNLPWTISGYFWTNPGPLHPLVSPEPALHHTRIMPELCLNQLWTIPGSSPSLPWTKPGLYNDHPQTITEATFHDSRIIPELSVNQPWIIPGSFLSYPKPILGHLRNSWYNFIHNFFHVCTSISHVSWIECIICTWYNTLLSLEIILI